MTTPPSAEDVIAKLRAHEQELRQKGVLHAAVFGSVARGEAGPNSDVDIMVVVDDAIVRTLFEYAGIYVALEQTIGCPIDLADEERLKPHVRPNALSEAIRAF